MAAIFFLIPFMARFGIVILITQVMMGKIMILVTMELIILPLMESAEIPRFFSTLSCTSFGGIKDVIKCPVIQPMHAPINQLFQVK